MQKIKQIERSIQPETKTEQTVDSEQSEVIPNEKINESDNTVKETDPSGKRKIFKRIWTFFLQRPLACMTAVGILLGGIAALVTGIDKTLSGSSNLSLKGEDIVKFIQAVKSEDSSQLEEFLPISRTPLVDNAIANAYRLQLAGEIEKAIKKWHSIINIVEGIDKNLTAEAWLSIGYLRVQQGEYEKAVSNFSKSLELKPDYVEAYYGRGDARLKIGKFKKVIDDFDKVLELKPDYVKAYYSRGLANLSLSKYKDANIDFKRALELKPNYIEAKKGLEETEVYLESIKPLNPNTANAEVYYSRGAARLKVGEFKKAIGDFNKALKLNSDYVEAYYSRAAAQFSVGQYQFAVADYNKFILLNPGSPSAYANRGEAKINLKQYKSAIADCDKAIQLDPNYAYAYYIRADAKYTLRDIEGGKLDLKTASKLAEEVGDVKLKDQIELRILINNLPEHYEKKMKP